MLKAAHHTSDSEQGKAAIAAIDKPYDSAKIAVFDISVSKNGEKIQPNGKVKVTMPKPFESDGYITYHIKDDNTVEELKTTVDGNNLTFETASFSYFVVAGLVNADQQHIHSYVEKVTDRNLVDNATCQRKAVYRLICSICGSLGTLIDASRFQLRLIFQALCFLVRVFYDLRCLGLGLLAQAFRLLRVGHGCDRYLLGLPGGLGFGQGL